MPNVKVRILKGLEAEAWKSLVWCVSRIKETYVPGDKVDGIKRRIWVNLTGLRMNRYRNQCIKNYNSIK